MLSAIPKALFDDTEEGTGGPVAGEEVDLADNIIEAAGNPKALRQRST
jgi:hypothetical protein